MVSFERWSFTKFWLYWNKFNYPFQKYVCFWVFLYMNQKSHIFYSLGFINPEPYYFLWYQTLIVKVQQLHLFWGQRSGSPLWFSRWSILPEDTLFADRINSLLIRLGPSIVFPFPARGNFIKWNFEKP